MSGKILSGLHPIALSALTGIKIGHHSDSVGGTGCTVILAEQGMVAGVEVRGGGPATRETDLLAPRNMLEQIHALVLSGGSAYGLDASAGVMQFLEEREIGFNVGIGVVPIVCGASLFDLGVGNPKIRPNKAMGYAACADAFAGGSADLCGNIGAGTGAAVGKILGPKQMMKSGLGTYAVVHQGLHVAALVAVNALGDIFHAQTGKQIAGLRSADGQALEDSGLALLGLAKEKVHHPFTTNTTIGCILTNARLTKAQAQKVAGVAHNGYAQCIFPVHTQADGDTIFTLATGESEQPVDLVAAIASQVMAMAITRGVLAAEPAFDLPAARSF